MTTFLGFKVVDVKGVEVEIDSHVKVGDEWRAVVTEITLPDVDDRDDERPREIPPYVKVRFLNGDEDEYAVSTFGCHPDDECPECPCDDIEVIDAKAPFKATITEAGVPGRHEPYAELEDGRTMPMGWNTGKTYEVGQKGMAKYVSTGSASLWQFTPDEEK